MRKALRNIGCDERHTFTAEFSRYGIKNGWAGDVPTVLLKDIRLGDKIVCDHLWFTCGKQFDALGLECGDIVQFDARVDSYWKGYMGYRDDVYDKPVEKDWKLSFPTKIKKMGRNENPETPTPPRPKDGESQGTLQSHADRVERARAILRLKPAEYKAVFVDGRGKEICTVDSLEAIREKLGVSEEQWDCFFKGLVGTPGKGDSVALRFSRRRKGNPAPAHYLYGIKMESVSKWGKTVLEGYGFIRAAYVVGWNEHSPWYVATHREEFDGLVFGKHNEILTYIPLGELAEWEMQVEGTEYWKNRFEERERKVAFPPPETPS